MKNTVCFFEITAEEMDSLQDFYSKMFDWKFTEVPGKFRYHAIDTGTDIKGGLTARQDDTHTAISYIKVESADEATEKAKGLGATVVVPKKAVPGHGWYVVLHDPQGNRLGLWQDDTSAA